MTTFVYLPEADIAINIALVTRVTFRDGYAAIGFTDDDREACTVGRRDYQALVAALGRVADMTSRGAMEARIAPREDAPLISSVAGEVRR